jgi:hypothetical protein
MIDIVTDFCPRCGTWVEALDECTGWCETCQPHTPVPRDRRRHTAYVRRSNARCAYCHKGYVRTHPNGKFCADHKKQQKWYKALCDRGYARDVALRLACQEEKPLQLFAHCIWCGTRLKGIRGRFCTGRHETERGMILYYEAQGLPTTEAVLRTRNRKKHPWVTPPTHHG